MALFLSLFDRLAMVFQPARPATGLVLMIGYENWCVVAIDPIDADL